MRIGDDKIFKVWLNNWLDIQDYLGP